VKELKQVRYNLDDLLGELRQNGYFNLQEIHYAILETDGSLSIVPYTAYEPPTREDFKIKVEDEPLPMPVILDGVINKVNLKAIGKDNYWLEENLSNNNIKSYKDVLIAIVYSNTHKFYFQLKNETTNASDNEKES